jgi:photosynthetic reaction center cytochrome c subunit
MIARRKLHLMRMGLLGLAFLIAVGIALMWANRPDLVAVQRGYRGTAMLELYDKPTMLALTLANKVPESLPQTGPVGPPAGQVYKNVQVLKDLSVGQFTRLMVSITSWVAPKQGCAYCHNPANMASDALYTKVVARRMIQMVQNVNFNWKDHVGVVGVTCYTCHRGQPVPANIWFHDPGPVQAAGMAQAPTGKNHPSPMAGLSSLPYDALTAFLEQSNPIRVAGTTALPTGNRSSIKQAEWTYALMMNFAQSLGVNCTYCHNTRSFGDWSQSTPQRVTAWYGIRMVRNLNNDYLDPLRSVFPHGRLGPTGDSPKVACATCHNGVYKPLFGVSMAKDFPELLTVSTKP